MFRPSQVFFLSFGRLEMASNKHSKRVGALGSRDFGIIDEYSPNYLDLDS